MLKVRKFVTIIGYLCPICKATLVKAVHDKLSVSLN